VRCTRAEGGGKERCLKQTSVRSPLFPTLPSQNKTPTLVFLCSDPSALTPPSLSLSLLCTQAEGPPLLNTPANQRRAPFLSSEVHKHTQRERERERSERTQTENMQQDVSVGQREKGVSEHTHTHTHTRGEGEQFRKNRRELKKR